MTRPLLSDLGPEGLDVSSADACDFGGTETIAATVLCSEGRHEVKPGEDCPACDCGHGCSKPGPDCPGRE